MKKAGRKLFLKKHNSQTVAIDYSLGSFLMFRSNDLIFKNTKEASKIQISQEYYRGCEDFGGH